MKAVIIPRPLSNPWTVRFLFVLAVSSVLVLAIVCAQTQIVEPVTVIFPLVAAILGVLAWTRFQRGPTAWLFLGLSGIVAAIGLMLRGAMPLDWTLLVLTYALIALYQLGLRRFRFSMLTVAPLLIGLLFLNTASLLGHLGSGGFPAALGILFTFILLATHELEVRTPGTDNLNTDPHIHIIHRKPLAWISIVFFLFGVISFWPWLGKLYGNAYFWILVLGVLAPLLFLWGRLRQPRHQNSLLALYRFNRLVPYLGFVLLLAIAVG